MLPFLLPRPTSGLKPALYPSASVLTALCRVRQPRNGFILPSSCSRSYAREADEEGDEELEGGEGDETGLRANNEHTRWLQTAGMTFRRPRDDGPNWLGGSVPFPMNPSFKPPPPISDKMRTQIFGLYTQNNHNEEWLSAKFGLSVSRVKAILRLKKLEQLWVKNRTCQHRFQADMERYLGVQAPSPGNRKGMPRDLARQIDSDVDVHAIGSSNRLQRVFYELVPEGEEPPLAQYMDLAEATKEEAAGNGAKKRHDSRPKNLVVAPTSQTDSNGRPFKSATRYRWFYPAKAGRAPYTFIDVGDRYRKAASTPSKPKGSDTTKQLVESKDKLALAQEELKQKRDQFKIDDKLAKQEAIKLKRKAMAQQELALAQKKVGKVDIKL
ncbi:hypothetical protein FRC18_011497 [Serendipita sp. 400]|nr:hypothetical protein FRC18_011497 [Serendipita sp. 400]